MPGCDTAFSSAASFLFAYAGSRLLLAHYLTVEEIEEDWPVRTGFVSTMMLPIRELAIEKTYIDTRDHVGIDAFRSKKFIYG